jgi:hypothetical protein
MQEAWIMKLFTYIILINACAVFLQCSVDHVAGGGGSDAGNGIFVGEVKNSNGTPALFATVKIFDAGYNPVIDSSDTYYSSSTTDSLGVYRFKNVKFGNEYSIIVRNAQCSTSALVSNVSLNDSITLVQTAVLSRPGAINVILPDTSVKNGGYVYVPGTDIYADIPTDHATSATLDPVPAGNIPEVCIGYRKTLSERTLRYNVSVKSSKSTTIFRTQWKHSLCIYLNTTESGANVSETVTGFPVLVRLDSVNFAFSQAQAGGSDIRFTKEDNTPLAYEIERWDSAEKSAEIWVRNDTIKGNDSSQSIVMYWGNSGASDSSSGRSVFDTSEGFAGVWHMSDRSDTITDATANSYHGTSYYTSSISGTAGLSRYFNGSTGYVDMKNTAYSKLNLEANGRYSISLWVYADTFDTLWHAIAGKGHEKYYLQLKGFSGNKASWEFVEFTNKKGWEYSEDTADASCGSGQWVYLTGITSGTHQQLFINGELVKDSSNLMTGEYTVNDSDNFVIGRYPRSVTLPYYQGYSYFKGSIDEVRVSCRARSAAWIKLCYMNQRADDKFTIFK